MRLASWVHGTPVVALAALFAVEHDLRAGRLAVLPLDGLQSHNRCGSSCPRPGPVRRPAQRPL
jgi:hypothetical protein